MKFFAATVFAAAVAGAVSAADCSPAQQTAAFTSLSSVITGTDLTKCADVSGYNMLQALAAPTDADKVKMCAAPSCHSLITTVVSKNPPNCDLLIPTSNAKMNVYSLASTFESGCARLASTPAPAATTATPTAAPASATPTLTSATKAATTFTTATTTASATKNAC